MLGNCWSIRKGKEALDTVGMWKPKLAKCLKHARYLKKTRALQVSQLPRTSSEQRTSGNRAYARKAQLRASTAHTMCPYTTYLPLKAVTLCRSAAQILRRVFVGDIHLRSFASYKIVYTYTKWMVLTTPKLTN